MYNIYEGTVVVVLTEFVAITRKRPQSFPPIGKAPYRVNSVDTHEMKQKKARKRWQEKSHYLTRWQLWKVNEGIVQIYKSNGKNKRQQMLCHSKFMKLTYHINTHLHKLSPACCQSCCIFLGLLDQRNINSRWSCSFYNNNYPKHLLMQQKIDKPCELEHSWSVQHSLSGTEQFSLQ